MKNWAIETGSRTDYLPGEPYNATAEAAEAIWRKATGISFLPVSVRRTTAEEDGKLGSAADAVNAIGKMRTA